MLIMSELLENNRLLARLVGLANLAAPRLAVVALQLYVRFPWRREHCARSHVGLHDGAAQMARIADE